MRPQRGLLTFGNQLQVFFLHRHGTYASELADRFDVHSEIIQSILDREKSLLIALRNNKQRVHLKL